MHCAFLCSLSCLFRFWISGVRRGHPRQPRWWWTRSVYPQRVGWLSAIAARGHPASFCLFKMLWRRREDSYRRGKSRPSGKEWVSQSERKNERRKKRNKRKNVHRSTPFCSFNSSNSFLSFSSFFSHSEIMVEGRPFGFFCCTMVMRRRDSIC